MLTNYEHAVEVSAEKRDDTPAHRGKSHRKKVYNIMMFTL